MDSPRELASPVCEQGQHSANDPFLTSSPDTEDIAFRSQPRFRVKRWRRDPPEPPTLLLACPKSSVISPRHQLNRWEEGMVSPNYKPLGEIALILLWWSAKCELSSITGYEINFVGLSNGATHVPTKETSSSSGDCCLGVLDSDFSTTFFG